MSAPSDTDEPLVVRRSVVPDRAAGSPWRAAIWTGLGAAIVCATLAIIAVAVCWLPVSGTTGRTNSSIRAGLLTFLAALHGGITVDGVSAAWLPLGMTLIVALTAWRAGSGLADAAEALGERDPARLALVGLAQAVTFTVGCLIAVPFATLGTSRAPFLGVALAGLLLFTATGGVAFVRSTALRAWCAERVPSWLAPLLRAASAAVLVYLAAGALLVAVSLVLHHRQVEALSAQVGGGWGSVPVLLLGILAAPNAVIAGSSYLAGPGFSVGSGTTANLFGTAHGTLPAFPVLGAMPSGHGANIADWVAVGLTAVLAGGSVARLVARRSGWWRRLALAAGAATTSGLVMLILGWQSGGAAGDGRLHTVGPSPWQLGGAVAAMVAVVAIGSLGLAAAWTALRSLRSRAGVDDARVAAAPLVVVAADEDDESPTDEVANDADADNDRGAVATEHGELAG